MACSDDHGEEVVRRHDAAVAAGEPGYVDPTTGFFVFTAATLAANGECCDRGCRHCPYGRGSGTKAQTA